MTFRGRCILGVWSDNWLFVVVGVKYCIVVFITIGMRYNMSVTGKCGSIVWDAAVFAEPESSLINERVSR